MSTVGLNEATIAKYIREQESHDIALDKLSVKEYEDPLEVIPPVRPARHGSRCTRPGRSPALAFRRKRRMGCP